MSIVWLIALSAIALAGLMALAWLIVLRTGKSGWADAIWSGAIGLVGLFAVLTPLGDAVAPAPRAWLVAAILLVWSVRLALHIALRTAGGGEDPRYAALKDEWGANWRAQMLLFLEIQAAAAFLLVLALLAAAHNPAPLGLWDALGVLIAIVAIGGEALADRQMQAFRADPANRGKVCDTGLWGLSRHPNYFFEWLGWIAYVPIALSAPLLYPWGFAVLIAPALIYLLLVHLSGIPPLEAHMMRSRPEAFTAYTARVRAFWPVPKPNRSPS